MHMVIISTIDFFVQTTSYMYTHPYFQCIRSVEDMIFQPWQ